MGFLRKFANPGYTTKFLIGYWLVTAAAALLLILLTAGTGGVDFREILGDPSITPIFVMACVNIMFVGVLRLIREENPRTIKNVALIIAFLQLVGGNPLGALLAYLVAHFTLAQPKEPFAPNTRFLLIPWLIFLALVSVLLTAVQINYISQFVG